MNYVTLRTTNGRKNLPKTYLVQLMTGDDTRFEAKDTSSAVTLEAGVMPLQFISNPIRFNQTGNGVNAVSSAAKCHE